MSVYNSNLSIRGRSVQVPTARINGREVVLLGHWLRTAELKDEEWVDMEPISDPFPVIRALRTSGLGADIFSFAGAIDGPLVKTVGRIDTDNIAVIRTDDFKAWWDGLPQETRKNARRAAKRGIDIRRASFDDEFVAGIKTIYDESPVRQGRQFWHYGKDIETVKRENGTYLDRCDFRGAYYNGELVGFMKWVYVGNAARIMQFLCLDAHQDKRPMIALIAQAAEVCHQKGMKYLIYGKFTYGRKTESGLSEFKRRLGFRQLNIPRYYVPLTWRGRIALRLGVHLGFMEILPPALIRSFISVRALWLQKTLGRKSCPVPDVPGSSQRRCIRTKAKN